VASLQKGVAGMLGVAKGLPNVLDDPVLALHKPLPTLPPSFLFPLLSAKSGFISRRQTRSIIAQFVVG
jgi:hypothetical protein